MWAFGQGTQLQSVNLVGVSKTMPISTGLQLVGKLYLVLSFWVNGVLDYKLL